MPLYEYECKKCSHWQTEMRKIAERKTAPECADCGAQMKLRLSAAAGKVTNPAAPKGKAR